MLKLRRGTEWRGKILFAVVVLRLRGRGWFGALCLRCRFLGSFDSVDSVGDGVEVENICFEISILEKKMRLAKSVFLLGLAGKSVE